MPIQSHQEVNQVLMLCFTEHGSALSEDARNKFVEVATSPVAPEIAAQIPELIYARMDDFPTEFKIVAADVCDFATSLGFYGLGQNARGQKISALLRGRTVSSPPEPKSQFVVASAAPAPVTPGAPEE